MRVFVNPETQRFFRCQVLIQAIFLLLVQGAVCLAYGRFSPLLALLCLAAGGALLVLSYGYFRRQDTILEQATAQINAYLAGDSTARVACDEEGELYRLFHTVNALAAVLDAHAGQEQQEKEFLKNTISDISHQLKTPLAALNIYNGLLQAETAEQPDGSHIKEYAELSERELDRMETLVQNLLKITRLDAGAIVPEKHPENAADMLKDVELHFAYRARQEDKMLTLTGPDPLPLLCDRDWLLEALDNLVKNALDHTAPGDTVALCGKPLPAGVQITIQDTGSGIAPEDLPHIFKRFYRSRRSQDTQGLGLGLPLAKAIVEAHGGIIEVESQPGRGTTFTLNFLNPTIL